MLGNVLNTTVLLKVVYPLNVVLLLNTEVLVKFVKLLNTEVLLKIVELLNTVVLLNVGSDQIGNPPLTVKICPAEPIPNMLVVWAAL